MQISPYFRQQVNLLKFVCIKTVLYFEPPKKRKLFVKVGSFEKSEDTRNWDFTSAGKYIKNTFTYIIVKE